MKQLSILFFFLLLSLSACATEKKTPTAPAPVNEKTIAEELKNKEEKDLNSKAKDCICIKMWMPVCGSDGKTYGNSCEANCRGVTFTQGECQAKK